MISDLKFAFRQLTQSPGFTAVALLTLALGIGACTAIFSIVNSVLLRPLAYPQSERLVIISETKLPQFPQFSVAAGNYFDWREQSRSFEQLAAVRGANYNLTGGSEPIRVRAERITPNYLATLRTLPALGRMFSEEEAASQTRLAILRHGFWQRQFGGRREVIGETVQLDGQGFTIIGVMPADFQPDSGTELFTPADYAENKQNHGSHSLQVYGRLKSGVTIEQASSELALIAGRLAQQYPDTNTGWSVKLTPMFEYAVGDVRPILYSLLGAVGFLLLIACANIASLLLARATARAKEISIRTALGASRARIIRQLLSESVLLAVLGAGLGIVVAEWGLSALVAFAPDSLPRTAEIALDARAFGFTTALALLTGIGFGLVPAFQATRLNLNETLKDGGRGSSAGGRQRLRGTLVIAEVAIALVLLVGAGLLMRSFARLQSVNPGFEPRDAFAASITLPNKKYGTQPQQAAFAEQAIARLAAIPGVESVGSAVFLPFSGDDSNLRFSIVGQPPVPKEVIQSTLYYSVTPDYFKAMEIRLMRGRLFTSADGAGASRVALINESMVKKFFAGQDPIGQRIKVTDAEAEIVGIVADVQHYDLGDDSARVQTYEPFAQRPFNFMMFVVRLSSPKPGEGEASGLAASLPAAIRSAIYSVDKDQPVASVRPLTDLIAASVSRPRFAMFLFAVFSGVALLLAAIGIYGVMAYSVNQRTREMGLRMALGAQRADVFRLIFLQGGRLVALGLICGVVGALLLTRFIASMLYSVSAHDPLAFVAVAGLLATVAAVACFLPARRATKVDPMVALRAE